MFDIAPTEFILIGIVALIVIGPSDLPKAMRLVGYWVGRARGVARQFRSGFDTMIRESELHEMEKRWAEENARIMAEHPGYDASATTIGDPAFEHRSTEDVAAVATGPIGTGPGEDKSPAHPAPHEGTLDYPAAAPGAGADRPR